MMLNKLKSHYAPILAVFAPLVAAICVFVSTAPTVFAETESAECTGVIQQFKVDGTGTVEISGYYDNPKYDSTTMLLTDTADVDTLLEDFMAHTMYIDQPELGNNGAFYMRFPIDEKFSCSPYVLKMNGGTLLTQTGTIPEIPFQLYHISNNALIVGNDAYDIGCSEYTPNNISQSIESGGNHIYYKIGGMWFDMLDKEATSAAYFTTANAIPEEEWSAWSIATYHHF